MFRDSEGYTINELLHHPLMDDITKRSLQDHIKEFKDIFGAEFDNSAQRGRENVWKYKDPTFSIFQQIDRDIEVIHKTILSLKPFEGDPQYDWLRLFLMSLENGIHDNKAFMAVDHNLDLEGRENIATLGLAILHKHPVKLKYKPFNHKAFSTNVHPYYLKQYNNRWFLMAWSEEKSSILNFPIDRISKIKHLDKPFIPTDVDFEEYFDDVVGVTIHNDAEIERVLLRVSKKSVDYIRTKPLHNTQKELKKEETADNVIIQLKVKINTELKMVLFSYRDSVEVLEPYWLRKEFAEQIRNMNRMYEV